MHVRNTMPLDPDDYKRIWPPPGGCGQHGTLNQIVGLNARAWTRTPIFA